VVWLVNAGDVKHLPGRPRPTGWIRCGGPSRSQRGMLRPLFVPPAQIRRLREDTRLGADLTADRTRHTQRLEQAAGWTP
jgi:transposase